MYCKSLNGLALPSFQTQTSHQRLFFPTTALLPFLSCFFIFFISRLELTSNIIVLYPPTPVCGLPLSISLIFHFYPLVIYLYCLVIFLLIYLPPALACVGLEVSGIPPHPNHFIPLIPLCPFRSSAIFSPRTLSQSSIRTTK